MPDQNSPLTYQKILKTWWPLALSWLLMALELPAISAVIARMENPKINLAAYGGIVFPLALIIEAPIIMLLAASTALSKDLTSYHKIRKFMHVVSGTLTAGHLLIAATPIYYFVSETLIGAPQEIIEPGRVGLLIMLPWTWSVAYRRFNQGVLIRYGFTKTVSLGTFIRLSTDIVVLLIGFFSEQVTGIVAATSAVALGVLSEAIFIGLKVRPVIQHQLRLEPKVEPELTRKAFLSFYIPLALTSLITLLAQPLVSSALSRMPRAIDSLALWPVIAGLLFLTRAPAVAFNEVVVALIDHPGAFQKLRNFTIFLTFFTSFLVAAVGLTPLSKFWFQVISALPLPLIPLAQSALIFGILVPAANSLQSWFQGLIVNSKHTRGIPEAVGVFLLTTLLVYAYGIWQRTYPGIIIGVIGFSTGMVFQACWLFLRSRPAVRKLPNVQST